MDCSPRELGILSATSPEGPKSPDSQSLIGSKNRDLACEILHFDPNRKITPKFNTIAKSVKQPFYQ